MLPAWFRSLLASATDLAPEICFAADFLSFTIHVPTPKMPGTQSIFNSTAHKKKLTTHTSVCRGLSRASVATLRGGHCAPRSGPT